MMAGGKMLSQSMAIYFSYVFILICNLLSPSNGNYPLLDVDTNMRIVLIPYDTPVSCFFKYFSDYFNVIIVGGLASAIWNDRILGKYFPPQAWN